MDKNIMPKRLTKRAGRRTYVSDELCMLCAYDEAHKSTFCENTTCAASKDRTCPYLQVIDRLAAYEDTGLTPLQVTDLVKKIRLNQQTVKNAAKVLDFLYEVTEG